METNPKKLYRSRTNRIFAGILGGIGKHFNLDPTLVRLVFAILLVSTGFAPLVFLYIILWFVIPEFPMGVEDISRQEKRYFKRIRAIKNIIIVFVILVIIFGTLVAARFFYHNVIIPWPYRHDLKNCLNQAENKAT